MPALGVTGTVGQTRYDIADLTAAAFRRCKAPSALITGEMAEAAPRILYAMLSDWSNRGVMLWTIDRYIIGFVQGVSRYALPVGTVDALNIQYRTTALCSSSTAGASSAGGMPASAFDGDLTTSCTQTSANGNISYNFGSPTTVTSIGWMTNGNANLTPVVEASRDNVNWTLIYTPQPDGGSTSIACADYQWTWREILNSAAFQYWRFRETGGATLNLRALQFGSNSVDIDMARMNIDDWSSLPNKQAQGRPLQYYVERLSDRPYIWFWYAPSDSFVQAVVWRHRHVMDPGSQQNTIEIPQRWIKAVQDGFAAELARELPNVQEDLQARLDRDAAQSMASAQMEERDNSPIFYAPNVAVYN
jgi:hypothetical protein